MLSKIIQMIADVCKARENFERESFFLSLEVRSGMKSINVDIVDDIEFDFVG